MTPPVYSPESLSVALVAYNASATIGLALDALASQTVQGFETLVVDSSTDHTAELVAERYPAVRVHRSAERLYPGKARNVAIRISTRPLIAFVDADCLADADWVERILAAFNAPEQAQQMLIGGSVGVANPETTMGWASFFCEFTPWLRTGKPRLVLDIPTCCYAMKREALDRFGPFEEQGYCSDTIFNWRASAAGHRPLFVPAIHVRHLNPVEPKAILAKQAMHGERFATIRVREQRWSRPAAIVRALTAPLLPALLWIRTGLRVMDAPAYRAPFVRATPGLLRVFTAWSLGEARGYWRRPD